MSADFCHERGDWDCETAVIAESNAAGTTSTNGSAAYTLVLPSGITLAQVTTAIAAL